MQLFSSPKEGQSTPNVLTIDQRREKLLSFVLASFLFLLLNQLKNVTTFPFDSGNYWELSNPAVFLRDANNIRGYVFPLLLFPMSSLAKISGDYAYYPYRICSSLIYAYLLTNLLPSFYQNIFGGTISLARRLVAPVFLATLMPGLIIYPLTDLAALLMLIGAVHIVLRLSPGRFSTRGFVAIIMAGIIAGAAYNTRTIYIFPVACMLLSIPFFLLAGQPFKPRILATSAFIAGLAIVSAPQALINLKTKGQFNPLVMTNTTGKSLFVHQLLLGITLQRYETSIDPSAPAPTRFFYDAAGEKLLSDAKIEKANFSVGTYLALLAKHPLDFAAIYGRHIVNGLDIRDGDVYVRDSRQANSAASLIGFLSLFACFVIHLMRNEAKMLANETYMANISSQTNTEKTSAARRYWYVWLTICLLPVASIVPGAIESRFFIPVYLLAFSTLAFQFNAREFRDYCWRHRALVFPLLFTFLALFYSISLTTMAGLRYTY
ncbi:MAG: hypothetical protein ACRERX_11235 [Pseudomonas sp.]